MSGGTSDGSSTDVRSGHPRPGEAVSLTRGRDTDNGQLLKNVMRQKSEKINKQKDENVKR